MNPEQAQALRSILSAQQVAAPGFLHEGVPYVSMVPFALLRDGCTAIRFSALAAHTRAMLAEPAVSLRVMAPLSAGALPRVTIQVRAASCGQHDPRHAEARAAYLGRFADSEPMFSFGDFALFVLARMFHQVAAEHSRPAPVNRGGSLNLAQATLDGRCYAGWRGARAATSLKRSPMPAGIGCARLAQSGLRAHPRKSRVPDETTGPASRSVRPCLRHRPRVGAQDETTGPASRSVRRVAGFAQAPTLAQADLAAALQ